MRRLVILGIILILISSMLIAGCVFEEEKKKEKDDDDDNGNGNGSPALNITELKHEPANPTETDDVIVTVKIVADNALVSVQIFFCDEGSGICTASEDMTPVTGVEGSYTYTLAAGTYTSGTKVKYSVLVSDSEGNNEDGEGKYTVQ